MQTAEFDDFMSLSLEQKKDFKVKRVLYAITAIVLMYVVSYIYPIVSELLKIYFPFRMPSFFILIAIVLVCGHAWFWGLIVLNKLTPVRCTAPNCSGDCHLVFGGRWSRSYYVCSACKKKSFV